MYSSTESAQNSARKPSLSMAHWRLLVVVFFYWILQWGGADLMHPFLRSMIPCDRPSPDALGQCPPGSTNVNNVCEGLAPRTQDYSGSSMCMDKNLVVVQSTAVVGRMGAFGTVASLFSQVFIGATLVDSIGRKPVMLLGLGGAVVFSGIFLAACFMANGSGISMTYLGITLACLIDCFPVASMAMASDLAHGDKTMQSLGYTAIHMLQNAGVLLAFGGGFFILERDLTTYVGVWSVFGIASVVIIFFSASLISETLTGAGDATRVALKVDDPENVKGGDFRPAPTSPGSPPEGQGPQAARGPAAQKLPTTTRGLLVRAFMDMVAAFDLVWSDPFLRRMLLLSFINQTAMFGTIGVNSSYALAIGGFSQAVASLGGVVQPAGVVCGAGAGALLLKHLGPYATSWVGMVVAGAGYFITGLCSPFHEHSQALFWGGWGVVTGFGFGMVNPAITSIVSLRVDNSYHGKLFAAKSFVDNIGVAVGTYVWSNFLFKSEATVGWMGGIGFFTAAAVEAVFLAGSVLCYRIYIAPTVKGPKWWG